MVENFQPDSGSPSPDCMIKGSRAIRFTWTLFPLPAITSDWQETGLGKFDPAWTWPVTHPLSMSAVLARVIVGIISVRK